MKNTSSTRDQAYLFSLPEYVNAFGEFVNDAMHEFAAAAEPLLGQMPRRNVRRPYQGRNSVGETETVETPLSPIRNRFGFSHETVSQCDAEQVTIELKQLAENYLAAVMPQVFAGLAAVTQAVGNSRDAGAQPLTWDLVLDLMSQIEIAFDDDDNPILPQLIVGEGTAIPEMTPGQLERMNQLVERKRVAHLAGRRYRKLSRDTFRD